VVGAVVLCSINPSYRYLPPLVWFGELGYAVMWALAHVFLYALLSYCAFRWLETYVKEPYAFSVVVGTSLAILAISFIVEVIQSLARSRYLTLESLPIDFMGVTVGYIAFYFQRLQYERRKLYIESLMWEEEEEPFSPEDELRAIRAKEPGVKPAKPAGD